MRSKGLLPILIRLLHGIHLARERGASKRISRSLYLCFIRGRSEEIVSPLSRTRRARVKLRQDGFPRERASEQARIFSYLAINRVCVTATAACIVSLSLRSRLLLHFRQCSLFWSAEREILRLFGKKACAHGELALFLRGSFVWRTVFRVLEMKMLPFFMWFLCSLRKIRIDNF